MFMSLIFSRRRPPRRRPCTVGLAYGTWGTGVQSISASDLLKQQRLQQKQLLENVGKEQRRSSRVLQNLARALVFGASPPTRWALLSPNVPKATQSLLPPIPPDWASTKDLVFPFTFSSILNCPSLHLSSRLELMNSRHRHPLVS
ncbi:hypothetical protein DPEC_G00332790 [Dallia pectoralis]|uniref:Uncharacterized protein n=1 Tax=Dallia pectoralis TaxID=75939 RepID=A0ACC2F657_DALPE|nr:hypothetical protein DPEC_G00332790 [Dallia pectoralis]